MPAARPRIRVGLLTEHADFYGGGQRSLRDLAAGLRGSGVEPLAILPGPGPLASALQKDEVEWAALPLPPVLRLGGVPAGCATLRLARLARTRGLDLLHSDSPRTALYAGFAALLARRPHLWHLRASRASSELSDRLLLRLSDAVVAVSGAAAGRSAALRASRKVRVVATGLPPIVCLDRAAARAALGLPSDLFVAGVIGRVEPDKGGQDAIAAFATLRAAAPGALLAFLGPVDRDGSWAHACRLRASSAGLSEGVLFLGERPEAASLLRAFDLILHPSRHEALPRSLIEALYAGVPIVAAAVGGVPEVIEPGRTGLLVAPHDAAGLGAAAAGLARDPALRRRLSEAGSRDARARFGLDRMVRDIVALYQELVAIRSRSSLEAWEVPR